MGGKSSKTTVGYWYHPAFHMGLGYGPADALLEIRGGDKTAWSGELTASGTITVNAPNLWGGEKDQGGMAGDMDIMFGEATQQPNAYLTATFGDQQPAWRGFMTAAWKGGRYGAMNPYPQKISYKWRKITKGWDDNNCWYPEKAPVAMSDARAPVAGNWPWPDWNTGYFLVGTSKHLDGPYSALAGWWQGYVDSIRLRRGAYYAAMQYQAPTTAFARDSSTVMLLNMDGPDGSTDFSDDCGHAVTAFNGAHITTDKSMFGGSSAYFDGVDDYLDIQMGADESLGSIPWTMDAWVWLESTSSSGFGRSLFGYGDKNITGHETEWSVVGTAWRYVQQQDINVLQPQVLETIDSPALGRWAFVSLCWDGARYWMHQDGQLLTTDAGAGLVGMNPAHILYYARTQQHMGREPTANMNDASFKAAADWFSSQGFGLCTNYDASQETIDAFIARIEKVAGCSMTRSPADGLWYLDIANGQYDINALPVLTDDDILAFTMQPATLDSAVNSVSVQFFDPQQKTTVSTRPVEALALVSAYGRSHQDTSSPEIPTSDLALRVAQRDLQSTATPTHGFEITATRVAHAWRKGTYFRMEAPKHGIADMVCIVGDPDSGTLTSGAIKLTAVEDIYSLPLSSFMGQEPGVDTRPSQIPLGILYQTAFEAPYFEVVRSLSRADLGALPDDAGYLMTAAIDPATSRDYTVTVSTDGGASYAGTATAPWCPAALIAESDTLTGVLVTDFTLVEGTLLDRVTVGSAALWDDEIVRVDAIDADAGTITLGRGCADTVPVAHAASSRIWFFDGFDGTDGAEYTAGETIDAKLLTNMGSTQLDPSLATALEVTFAQRQYRPYPPADVQVNGVAYPASVTGDLVFTWAHRDRILEADQLIDTTQADVGPEAGTTYNLRIYNQADALLHSETGMAGTTFTFTNDAERGGSDDPYWSYVTALLHFDGTDGSKVFKDEIAGNTWAVVGTSSIKTAQSKFGGASLGCLASGGADCPHNAGLNITSGDFTLECWCYPTSAPSGQGLLTTVYPGSGNIQYALHFASSTTLGANSGTLTYPAFGYYNSAWHGLISPNPITVGAWSHIAVSRNGDVFTLYVNGTMMASATIVGDLPATTQDVRIGTRWDSTVSPSSFPGYIDDLRITKGVGRYTASFMLPNAAFPNASFGLLNGSLRIELESERDALISAQHHGFLLLRSGYGFNYGMFYGGTP